MISNMHTKTLPIPMNQAAPLIDSLASNEDKLWPNKLWPPMRFDRSLSVGAKGGHGPIRYFVSEYQPGKMIRFTFTGPKGFDGTHGYTFERVDESNCKLIHTLEMNTTGWACLTWPLVYRPLHDALIEDSLTQAERFSGLDNAKEKSWSALVKFLRRLASAST